MKNENTEKLLKALLPLSCTETRQLFPQLLRNGLDQGQEDWAREHLTLCDECLVLLTDTVETQVDSGALARQQVPDDISFPPMEAFFCQQNRKEPMGRQKESQETSKIEDFNLHALEAVDAMARQAEIHPEQIRRRLWTVGVILAVGVAGIIATLFSIVAGLPASEPVRLLAVFLLIGSLALTLASSVAWALITWSAFVYQYVRAEKKKTATRILLDAVIDLGHEPSFDRAVLNLLLEELRSTAADASERTLLDQALKIVLASDLRDSRVGEKLAVLLRSYLVRREDVSRLLDNKEDIPHAA
jgi:hypothetical protein